MAMPSIMNVALTNLTVPAPIHLNEPSASTPCVAPISGS